MRFFFVKNVLAVEHPKCFDIGLLMYASRPSLNAALLKVAYGYKSYVYEQYLSTG